MSIEPKTGVLPVNVGTPDAPRAREVRRYLREFLGDPRVLDMNALGRYLLLRLVILPWRPRRSAEAYRAIWEPGGSPLLLHTRRFAEALGRRLGERFEVVPAMRYGEPSIAAALETFRSRGIDRVVVLPMYPQFASSTTGTSLEAVYRLASSRWNVPLIANVPPFYDDPGFLSAFARVGLPVLDELRPEHVLFSFHGLPERQVRKSDDTGRHCLAVEDCCAAIATANRNCYRAQCFATARGIARAAALGEGAWSVAFQSRLGRTPWIRPYADERVRELARAGVRRVAVFCPAFVADCLETLEEIGIRARRDFVAHGGEELRLVPSLNADPAWIDAAAALVRRSAWTEADAVSAR